MAYLTPANSGVQLPPMPLGPGSGFMWGMNIDAANQMNQRMLRDNDLEYAINQIKQQADQSNLDVTKAKNMNELLNQAILKQQYDSGGMQTAADAALNANISGNQSKAVQSQDAIQLSMQAPTVQMAEYIKARGGKLDPTNQADIDEWNKFSNIAKYHGIKTPGFPDPQQQQALLAKRDAYIQSADYQQKIGAIQAQGQNEKAVAGINAASREAAAQTAATGHVDAAKVTSAANIQRTQIMAEAQRNQQSQLLATMAMIRRKGGYDPEDVALVRQQATLMFLNGPDYEIARTVASTRPEDPNSQAMLANIQRQAAQQAEAWLSQDPSFRAAAAKLGGGQSATAPSTQSTAPKSDGPVQLNGSKEEMDSQYNSLKSGDTYIDPNGVTRRKQ